MFSPLQIQPWDVSDFSGGITDNYLDGRKDQYQYADNLLITNNRKLITRPGSEVSDTTNYLPDYLGANTRTNLLFEFEDFLFEQQTRSLYYNDSGYTTILGPTGNPALPSGDSTNKTAWAYWNHHTLLVNDSFCTPQKLYLDSSNDFQIVTAGLPALASTPTLTPGAGARTYIYVFCYTFEYTVGSVTFKDFGPTTLATVSSAAEPSASTLAVSAIPVLANGVTQNYDTATIKVEIYRTINAGQTLYYVGEVTNGTTTYNDTSSDATIQTHAVIYTDGGVYDNDPPPPAKFVTVTNDIAWYAHVKEGTEVFTNRVRQSVKFDIDACPESFYIDVEDEITGISSVSGYPIVFCKQRIYRLEGFIDLTGRGSIEKREISRITGCKSHLGIVSTLEGIYFPGNDGFYFTDGYRCVRVSSEINDRYLALSNPENIYGVFHPTSKCIYWSVKSVAASTDNDSLFICDTKYGIKPDMPFTTASGGTSFSPTALCVFENDLYRADRRGYLFRHGSELKVDPVVDVNEEPEDWISQTIVYNYVSCATNFGNTAVRKWVPKIVWYGKNVSNVSIGINSLNDDSTDARPLKEIRVTTNVIWGDSTVTWGDASCIWNYSTMIKVERNFPARGLRCDYKQVQFTNAFTNIDKSDALGTATVNTSAKTVTLNVANKVWPDNSINYYIAFDEDDYEEDFLVTDRTDTVLTYQDPLNVTVASSTAKWVLRGYRKGDIMSILNYTLFYAYISDTQDKYSASNTGANS